VRDDLSHLDAELKQ